MDIPARGKSYRINCAILHDRRLQQLSGAEYKRQLYAALQGEQNAWTPFIRPDSGRPPGQEWAALRTAVFARDDYTCSYCGQRGGRLECDHILPVSRGGAHDLANLTTACFACNRSKRAKTLEEWLA